ncbi:MAG: exopolyphosphatase [Promicromonosporaceae bacterium]|nr:exopolyphosphatase [Promicromonosporaceae bacterium]
MLRRVAAIDCGTNSIRLLIQDRSPDADSDRPSDEEAAINASRPPVEEAAKRPSRNQGRATDLVRRADVVRLGQDVDKTGQFASEALERVFAQCRLYAELLTEHRVPGDNVRFVATSASRDVSNRQAFFDGVRSILGVTPDVVSGAEEARLSFVGATSALPTASQGGPPPAEPHLVVDLGGGSTELVLGTAAPEAALSMDVGSVRLAERYFRSDPPSASEVEAARADVAACLEVALGAVPLGEARTLIGVAGTITSITAMCLGLERYDRAAVGGAVLPVGVILAKCAELLTMNRVQRAAIPTLQPGRVDVISAGALVWSAVIERVVAESGGAITQVVTSEHDILDGIAASVYPAAPARR